MRPIAYVLSFVAVLFLGFWAYRENYQTRQSLDNVDTLQQEIGLLREALAVQRAEWAYLNRPARLRELAALNYDSLGLMPLDPAQFGHAAQVAYPATPDLISDIDAPVDVMGEIEQTVQIP